MDNHKSEHITGVRLYNYWVQCPIDVRIEILGRVILKRYQSMSSGRKLLVFLAAALAVTIFIGFAVAILGAMSPALRIALWALALGLLIGGLLVWMITR